MTNTETATLGGGCFWCVEAAFEALPGVVDVTSGYAGGHTTEPTYQEVCSGETGHAEVVRVEYDSDELAFADVLKVFFTVHDPTQLNRQGPDVGSQYRSIVLAHDDDQRELAEAYIEELAAEGVYDEEIVTEVEPLGTFYRAEEHHQDYYEKNPGDAYCTFHADPKIEKVRKLFVEAGE
ncbi:peptide-methionine (S)-S-oxide reductase MsrA [Halorubrum sp. JWXQ-INN 858]|uniref:peptide-methionine (S)-S-oxide reductase MsrA n=1 Tax=Halorubrum sp. JWXQ-INN 858 TaxID=2690782 RepID=UPI001357637E|nr:peptide-methionine (S)-S-oxide reductase MsrA [Halorubrum sp. JWXQ-INN 858]MWV64999.1 peptide-methionine (S)-S-oxide reductase MsrA [Halorubrum sp. JWXQ-INN 858]